MGARGPAAQVRTGLPCKTASPPIPQAVSRADLSGAGPAPEPAGDANSPNPA